MDIIMFALARWDGPYSSTSFSLAKEFSKKNRIFYIDNPFTYKFFISNYTTPQVKKRIPAFFTGKKRYTPLPSSGEGELIAVTPGLTLPINFLPSGKLYEQLASVNDAIVFKTIRKLLIDYSIKDFIFINSFNPFYLHRFPAFFKPKLFVYITVDDIRQSKHISKHGPRLEAEMIQRAHVTCTTSRELKRINSELSPNVHYLPNAADISLFKTSVHQNLALPEELISITQPIVIYTGHIDPRIDYDLLKCVIKRNPSFVFLMVGPISIDKQLEEELRSLPNILFTGKKDITELPAFLKQARAAIIPFKCNVLTKSIYPLKINEYLAAGKPVISTPFSEDIQSFEEIIKTGHDCDTFSKGIVDSVATDSTDKVAERLRFVENNTWEARINQFWGIVNNYLEK